jgi:hypothetical protein
MTGITSKDSAKIRPYSPSWIDRFNGWVERRRGPTWAYYSALAAVLFLPQVIALLVEGALASGAAAQMGFLSCVIAFILGLFHYLDDSANVALTTLRPALDTAEEKYSEMEYRLTTLPAFPTLLAGLVALGIVWLTEAISGPYRLQALAPFRMSYALLRTMYLLCWWVFGGFVYHTVHQLMLINHIYTKHTRINLFRMTPLHAFSSLTAFTAGSLVVIPFSWVAINPDVPLAHPAVLIMVLAIQVVAVAAFIWPQLGIHRLQSAEKSRLLDETSRRFEAAVQELHRRVDSGQLEGMSDLNMALAGLELERNTTKQIPTWPWQPETVRWLATALVLPLALWLIQFVMQRTLTP